MKFLRTPHFKQYVEDMFVWAGKATHAWTEQAARDKFKETMYEDFNSLFWIMENVFPNSRRNGDDYEFITGDMTHQNIGGRSGPCGQLTLTFMKKCEPRFSFSDPGFIHCHITKDIINCWGGYGHTSSSIVKNGFASALMDMYNFASVSQGSTFASEG